MTFKYILFIKRKKSCRNQSTGFIFLAGKPAGAYRVVEAALRTEEKKLSGIVNDFDGLLKQATRKNTENKKETAGEGGVKYSLPVVRPIIPSSDKWYRGHTKNEIRKMGYPIFRDINEELLTEDEIEELKAGHGTQISSTKATYFRFFSDIKSDHPDDWQKMRVLDASSGKGLGTGIGRARGFNVTDIEPFPPEGYKPAYKDYTLLKKEIESGKTKPFDYIICNAVLNVLPQDTRDNLVVTLDSMLKNGGVMYINAANKSFDSVKNATKYPKLNVNGIPTGSVILSEEQNGAGREVFVYGSNSVQKAFSAPELRAYLTDALPGQYEIRNAKGMTAVYITKISESKNEKSDSESVSTVDIDVYSEKQYNDYGWTRVHGVLTEGERRTVDSAHMAYTKGFEKRPVTENGEVVILLGNNKNYTKLVYVKGTPEKQIITKVYSGESLALKEVETLEGIRSRNALETLEIYEEAGYVKGSFSSDYPSYSESKRRRTGSERTGVGNSENDTGRAGGIGEDTGSVKYSVDLEAEAERQLEEEAGGDERITAAQDVLRRVAAAGMRLSKESAEQLRLLIPKRDAVKAISDRYNFSQSDGKELSGTVHKMLENLLGGRVSFAGYMQDMTALMRKEVENAGHFEDVDDAAVKKFKTENRNRGIYLSPEDFSNVAESYGGRKALRDATFGKLNVSDDKSKMTT